jgi:hypothetical protein
MNDNYLVWAPIELLVDAYTTMDDDGNVIPDALSQPIVRRMLIARVNFFHNNGLLNVNPFDSTGKLIDRQYFKNDLTDDGISLCKRKVGAWMSSKGAKKAPPDMRLLERELSAIRAGK